MKAKTRTFDCVQMKREGARRVYELVKDMTKEEELAFWRKRTAELRRRQEKAREASENS